MKGLIGSMKIAVYHELHHGGARRAVWELGKRLSKKHKVDLFLSANKTYDEEKEAFGRVFSYPFEEKKRTKGDWGAKLYKDTVEYFKLLKHNQKIADVINKRNYDLVLVHPSQFTQAPFVLLFLKKTRVYYCQEPPRIIYDTAINSYSGMPIHKEVYERIVRLMRKTIDRVNVSRAEYILVNSKFSKSNVKKAYGLKAKVVYLGVDHRFFVPGKLRKNIDVLYIGTKEEVDNYRLFTNVKQQLPRKIVVHEHFTSDRWIADKALRNLYQRTNIVVVLQRNEPFGLIPIEAAACGCVVVALNKGGYRESVIEGKTGYLIEESEEFLKKRIVKVLQNKKLIERIGAQARQNVVKNWTWDRSASLLDKQLVKIYEETT